MEKKEKFSTQIEKSSDALIKGRMKKEIWHYASIVGVGGWLFVIPVIAGAFLGKYMDRHFKVGISWTITLILLGLAVGIYNTWYFFSRKSER